MLIKGTRHFNKIVTYEVSSGTYYTFIDGFSNLDDDFDITTGDIFTWGVEATGGSYSKSGSVNYNGWEFQYNTPDSNGGLRCKSVYYKSRYFIYTMQTPWIWARKNSQTWYEGDGRKSVLSTPTSSLSIKEYSLVGNFRFISLSQSFSFNCNSEITGTIQLDYRFYRDRGTGNERGFIEPRGKVTDEIPYLQTNCFRIPVRTDFDIMQAGSDQEKEAVKVTKWSFQKKENTDEGVTIPYGRKDNDHYEYRIYDTSGGTKYTFYIKPWIWGAHNYPTEYGTGLMTRQADCYTIRAYSSEFSYPHQYDNDASIDNKDILLWHVSHSSNPRDRSYDETIPKFAIHQKWW